MADIFKSPQRMLGRAKRQLADLETQINSFAHDKPWEMVVEKDLDGITNVLKVKFTKHSDDLPHIVFECVNNLRAVLDQAAFARVSTNPKSAKFPFGPDETKMLENAKGIKDLPTEILDLFMGFKPYKGGNIRAASHAPRLPPLRRSPFYAARPGGNTDIRRFVPGSNAPTDCPRNANGGRLQYEAAAVPRAALF